MKIGFVYAGQGSQKVGMGKSFYDNNEEVKAFFDGLDLPMDVRSLCFEGPIEELSQTINTQPCMVACAVAATDLLKEQGIEPEMVCGLSLGEYSALYGAGVFDKETVMDLVCYRAKAMTEAAEGIDCGMMAILGMDRDDLLACCKEASDLGVVEISNYNCPGQLVIGGERLAVEKAAKLAVEGKAKRAVSLQVSVPFHTSLLLNASVALHDKLQTVEFNEMKVPVLFNTVGGPLPENKTIADMLEKQVMSPVYLEDSIRYMIDQGVDTIVEIGPGKVLSGFVRKIDRSIKCYQVEDQESLEKTVLKLKGE